MHRALGKPQTSALIHVACPGLIFCFKKKSVKRPFVELHNQSSIFLHFCPEKPKVVKQLEFMWRAPH